jgi:hypothetical protein
LTIGSTDSVVMSSSRTVIIPQWCRQR